MLYYNRAAAYTHLNKLENAEKDAEMCVQLDSYRTAKYTLRLVQIYERLDKLIDALEAIHNCFGVDEQLTKLQASYLSRIDKDPAQTNLFRLLNQIKDKPNEEWKELVFFITI